ISSWIAARADHAAHQSSQRETDAVTSWKSASGTPFATKRGAQWEIAASTRGSISVLVWMTADMFSGSPLKRIPPRRFAPPLRKRGGEIRTGLSIPNSCRAQYPQFVSGSVSPPLLRRGAAEGGGVVQAPSVTKYPGS